MNKDKTKILQIAISAAGMAIACAVFLYWLRGTKEGLLPCLAAALSAGLFCALCLRFVPVWLRFWSEEPLPPPNTENASRSMHLKIFAALLLFCAAVIALGYGLRFALGYHSTFRDYLSFWTCTDSQHYLDIARDWYLSEGEWDRLVQLVFLPGYPLAIRAMHVLVENYLYAGLIVSALCFAGAGCVFYALLRLDFGHSDALRALKFLCLWPGAFFFAAPMSESLFLLLSLGCVYLARRRRWLPACLCGALASFTRSVGLTLVLPVLFEMGAALAREEKRRWARLALLLFIPAGFGAYCYVNYTVSGNPFQYLVYQSQHWGQRLGFFFNTAAYQLANAMSSYAAKPHNFWGLWLPNLLASFGALALLIPAAKRLRPSYTAYAIAYFVLAIGATWLLSAPRYLTVLFPLPTALVTVTKRRGSDAAATLCCTALGVAYFLAFLLRWQVW